MSIRQIALRPIHLRRCIANYCHYRPILPRLQSIHSFTTANDFQSHHIDTTNDMSESHTTTADVPTTATTTPPTSSSKRVYSIATQIERKLKEIDKKKVFLEQTLESAQKAKNELRISESEYRTLVKEERQKIADKAKALAVKEAAKARVLKRKEAKEQKRREKLEDKKRKKQEKKELKLRLKADKKNAVVQRLLEKEKRLTDIEKAKLVRMEETKLLKEFPDPNLPKRPSMPWPLYYAHYLKENNITSMTFESGKTVITKASQAWANMSESEKAPFLERSDELRSEYKVLKSIYDGTDSRQQWLKTAKHLKESKPRVNLNGYALYCQQTFTTVYVPPKDVVSDSDEPLVPSKCAQNAFKTVSAMWKALPEEGRQAYIDKAAKAMREWKEMVSECYDVSPIPTAVDPDDENDLESEHDD